MSPPDEPLPRPRPPGSPLAPRGWPVLRIGFRPFYLGAAAFAALAVPLWVAMLLGAAPAPRPVPALLWHAHEMLFGFAGGVIVGFLLTAGRAWTGLGTPRGATLAALALLWLAARVAAVVAPHPVHALLDLPLLPIVALILLRVLLRAGSRRNLPIVAILALLAIANGTFHLAAAGLLPLAPMRALHAGLALIVLIECVIAGRIVPAFTMSALPGRRLQPPRPLETATLAVTALALALWVSMPPGAPTAAALALAAALNAARLWHWQPLRTRSRPILWVLHLGYAWIPVGLALLALAQLGPAHDSAGIHALGVGATGGLIVGMITRTARGHTGRPLTASRTEAAAYLLVAGAAVVRVFGPVVAPQLTVTALVVAAAAWSAAFALYLAVFGPWLVSTRADGKDG